MIEDMTHLRVLDALSRELLALIYEYNSKANGERDKATLVALQLEQNARFVELLRQQRRALQHMAGLPVEPEHHEATAVLVGVGGLASP